VIACHYAGRVAKRHTKKKNKCMCYYSYAVYGLGKRSVQASSAAYNRRFVIESDYRQLHEAHAKTRSNHTGLRLLLIGLAPMLVSLYEFIRARCAIITRYGPPTYLRVMSLNEVATALLMQIQSLLAFSPEFYYRARGTGNQFIS
jgi:hypothetical protein